ncbi:hypothetical protein, partial [Pseudomonas aeruginosa]|uniref:hypothetical protein n=1 Tax=Pseudomonas aeruginosa TaxID=287 RepID=UPI001C4FDE03
MPRALRAALGSCLLLLALALGWLLRAAPPAIREPNAEELQRAGRPRPGRTATRASRLYTSDAAHDMKCADLGGVRIIKTLNYPVQNLPLETNHLHFITY